MTHALHGDNMWHSHPASLVCLIAISLIGAGCSSTRVAQSSTDLALYREINERGTSELAMIQMRTGIGDEYNWGNGLLVGIDTTSWIEQYTLQLRSVRTSDISRVTFRNHWRGVLKGAGGTALFGAGTGFFLGAVVEMSSRGGHMRLQLAAGLGLVFSAVGGATGFLAGGLVGERADYVLDRFSVAW